MNKKLIHYSTKPLDIMKRDEGWHFKVKTQGRLYTTDKVNPRGKTTTTGHMVSAIIFEGKATEQFKKHTWWTAAVWKRPCGQYYTRKVGDVVWSDEDMELATPDVMVVKNCGIVPIKECKRWWTNFIKILAMKLIDMAFVISIATLLFFILTEGLKAPSGYIAYLFWGGIAFLVGLGVYSMVAVRFEPGLRERVQKVLERPDNPAF